MDDREVQSALARYAAEKEIPISKAMRMSARRIAANLTFETEPRGFDAAAEKAGKNAILGDIRRIYSTASQIYEAMKTSDNLFLARSFYAAMKNGELEKARGYLSHSVSVWKNVPIGVLNPMLHQMAHNVPGGRVSKRQAPQMIVAAENLIAYIAYIQDRSGLAASAWAACATKLGGTREIPKWKKGKHGVNKNKYAVTDDSTNDNANISMENFSPYIDRVCDERKMQRVVDREEEVLADLIERALQAAAKRSGFL